MIYKEELVRKIAKTTRLSQSVVADVLNGYVAEIKQALAANQPVQHTGFGTFYARERKERQVRHIRTKHVIAVPAGRVAAFRVGETLKRKVALAAPKSKKAGRPRKWGGLLS